MPSRSDMDRPAMVAVAVLGVVLIAVSAPFLGSVGEGGGQDYLITWNQSEAGSSEAPLGAAGSTTNLRVPVTDSLPSNATVQVESCNDDGQPPVTQTATIAWTLFRGDEEVDDGTASCANLGPFRVALGQHPDVGSTTAGSAAEAQRNAYAAGDNETAEYRLEVTWSRPPAAGGLPLPAPAFSATVSLTVEEWTAAANTPDQEVPR